MFCDLTCKYAGFPQEKGVDGSGSCRTFVALYCQKKERLVQKNAPCPDYCKKRKDQTND